jgi:hypothetical protein
VGKIKTIKDSMATHAEASERRTTSATEREGGRRERSAEREANAAAREAAKAQAAKEKEEKKATAIAEKEASKVQKAKEKEELAVTKAFEREALKREKELERIGNQAVKDANKVAQAEIEAAEKAAKGIEKAHKKANDEIKRFTSQTANHIGNSVSGIISRIANLGGLLASLGGGLAGASILSSEMQNEKDILYTVNASKNDKGEAQISVKQLTEASTRISNETGTDKGEVIDSVRRVQGKSGNAQMALELTPFLAQIAKATGSKLSDLSDLAGQQVAQNPNAKAEDVQRIILTAIRQGEKGNIEIKDMAAYGSAVTAQSSLFKGDRTDSAQQLLGIMQIAGTAVKDAAEASTATKRFAIESAENNKERDKKTGLNKLGFNADGMDPNQLLLNVWNKTRGDAAKLKAMGYGSESQIPVRALEGIFQSGRQEALKAGKSETEADSAGYAAVRNKFEELKPKDFQTEMAERMKQFGEIMNTTGETIQSVFNEIRNQLGDELLPILKEVAHWMKEHKGSIAAMVSEVGKWVKWAAENPWKAVIAVLGVALLKELAVAGIGAGISAAFQAGAPLLANPVGIAIAGVIAGGVVAAAVASALKKAYDETPNKKPMDEVTKGQIESSAKPKSFWDILKNGVSTPGAGVDYSAGYSAEMIRTLPTEATKVERIAAGNKAQSFALSQDTETAIKAVPEAPPNLTNSINAPGNQGGNTVQGSDNGANPPSISTTRMVVSELHIDNVVQNSIGGARNFITAGQ